MVNLAFTLAHLDMAILVAYKMYRYCFIVEYRHLEEFILIFLLLVIMDLIVVSIFLLEIPAEAHKTCFYIDST